MWGQAVGPSWSRVVAGSEVAGSGVARIGPWAGVAEKRGLDLLLHRVRHGTVTVEFWDGERRSYGDGRPAVTVRITDPSAVRRAVRGASVAFGEAYAAGDIDVAEDELPALFQILHDNRDTVGGLARLRRLSRRHRNRRGRQSRQIRHHYDVGNDYYRLFLDPSLTYSCAYFEHRSDALDQAQRQKINHVLHKLRLQPGQRLLDIGCGWGYLAVTAALDYQATVVGITLSAEQLAGARELAARAGVGDRVQFALCNYQDLADTTDPALTGPFDRVVSVGMFEHAGRAGQARYVRALSTLLAEDGVSVLHTITDQRDEPLDAFTDRHVFPGGRLPTVARTERLLAEHRLWSLDRENLWQHYAATLAAWQHRRHHQQIVAMFGEPFYRTRDLWLAASQAGFTHGDLGLSQFVISKGKPAHWPLTRRDLYPNARGAGSDDGAGSGNGAGPVTEAPPRHTRWTPA